VTKIQNAAKGVIPITNDYLNFIGIYKTKIPVMRFTTGIFLNP